MPRSISARWINLQISAPTNPLVVGYIPSRISQIKALWLELRPELVEVRHRYLLETAKREQVLGNIYRPSKLRR